MDNLLDHLAIRKALPTLAGRWMLDRAEIGADSRSGSGVKAVSMDELFFQGHFPVRPIMPGVLQLAAMEQLIRILSDRFRSTPAGHCSLRSLKKVKFRRPVLPGDFLVVRAELIDETVDSLTFRTAALVDGRTTCSGELVVGTGPAFPREPEVLMRPLPDCARPAEGAEVLDIAGILERIPHRYPFVLLDRVLRMTPTEAAGLKNITANEPCFSECEGTHFPPYLQLEAAAQMGCVVALSIPGNEEKLGYFMSIDSAEFRHPVFPGDQLVVSVSMEFRGRFGKGSGALWVGDTVVAETSLKFAIVDAE